MKPETVEPDWTALARYVAGESSVAEAEVVRRWLAEAPGRAELLATLDRSTRVAGSAAAPVDVEAALSRVKARFGEPAVVPMPVRPGRRPAALGIAAALLLLAGGTLLWRELRSGSTAAPLAEMSYRTTAGVSDTIGLPDGSQVILAPGSELTVSAGYGQPDRRLALRGEAFFEVRHDASQPFALLAGGALIQDLGTSFGVRSDGEGVRVIVVSGAVLLSDTARGAPRSVQLKAGEIGVLGREREPVRRPAGVNAELAWTGGRLVFDNASLTRVRDDLRRWYGLELIIADSALADRHVHASFRGESVAEVLHTLSLMLGARVERHGDTAVLRQRAGRPRAP